ncbi:MAG: Holliday junction branch migration DNA helicase RuvB, partial [Alphaproteobacteria bacterium]|nr:Holliday junction branch migration DNA helicase RuvB [Alphaproteobacteria bacterium]
MNKQILQREKLETDNEINLRPNLLEDFIGQEQIKANLGIFI